MRLCGSVLMTVLGIVLSIALTGCLGKNTSSPGSGGVKSVALSPSGTISIEVGTTQVFSASAQDASGHAIPGINVQYIVSAPPGSNSAPPLSITSAGNACAGTWDASQAICSPGSSGIAIVSAVANGVSSGQTTVYVHLHIDSLELSQAQPVPPVYDCFSQGQTWIYQAIAYSKGVDISDSVGPVTWSSTNTAVLTTNTNPSVSPPLPINQVQITAVTPGITELFASASGSTSNSIPITTCLIQYIRLQAAGSTASSVSVNNGSAIPLLATAVDTLGFTLSKPPLTWMTSEPEVVSFANLTSSTGTNSATARNNLGGADVSVSCSPPTCNVGVLPGLPVTSAMPTYIFADNGPISPLNPLQGYGSIGVDVTSNSTPPTFTAWAATNQCGDTTSGCTSVMFAVTPTTSNGTNPIGATVTLPRTPNSMMFNHQSRIYLGSDQGLMYVDATGATPSATLVSSASTPCNIAVCGTLLAISTDGKQVIVFDDSVPATPQVYIYNSGASSGISPVTPLTLPPNVVVSAASFSPDESKVFILTSSGTMYVYSTLGTFTPVTGVGSGTDIAFSSDGSFAYVATAPSSVGAYSMCSLTNDASANLGNVTNLTYTPLQLFPSPVFESNSTELTQNIFVLDPPTVQVLSAQFTQSPLPVTLPGVPSQYFCNVPTVNFSSGASYNLGQGNFAKAYARMVSNGNEIVIVARYIPAILIFSTSDGSTRSIPLTNSFDPLSASSSSDGSAVFVAACDQYQNNDPNPPSPCIAGSVHIINTITGNDQQVPYINNTTNNMCNGLGAGAPTCFPDLIAIKPQ